MDPRFQELASEIAVAVEKRLSGAFEQRMKMHFENLEGVVRGAGEAYGGNLDRIERELNALNKKFDTKFGDHDRVLDNHNERLIKLERPSETPI